MNTHTCPFCGRCGLEDLVALKYHFQNVCIPYDRVSTMREIRKANTRMLDQVGWNGKPQWAR